ncbi:MAG: sigma-54 dependent transcriptional regulator [Nitrococcus sp.]|nr:sigma-54 dependent transcriptional regulator [Nitrococcus sp.]
MERLKIDLIAFPTTEVCTDFCAALTKLGYDVQTLSGPCWLATRDIPQSGSARLLYLSGHNYPCANLCSRLDEGRKPPTLAIVPLTQWHWDNALLSRCYDLLAWPCRDSELEYRVKRITEHQDSTAVSEIDLAGVRSALVRVNLVGNSPSFRAALALIKKLSNCNVPTLIAGETGTGKELAARAIHYLGARKDNPFVPVNCGAIPAELFENELFGHERGAYTDAKNARMGLIGQAQNGTLFLDEIDSLSSKAQVALLRFLQDQQYTPLGARRARQADVRIIAATNADLELLVEADRFRQDLLFRINVFPLPLPPLRERAGDIAILANHYIQQYCAVYGQSSRYLHSDALLSMEAHSWPGNVRELENVVHRALVLSDGESVTLPFPLADGLCRQEFSASQILEGGFRPAKARAIAEFERDYLTWLMRQASGNISQAAKLAGKERRALGKLLRKYGISENRNNACL